jgi:predicted HNH restriction endonuclease
MLLMLERASQITLLPGSYVRHNRTAQGTVLLCPNCHAMLHRKSSPCLVEEFRALMQH